jgi:exopolysaccharide biosynthesis polyprenyl glycosylphosphotransferase
MENPQFGYVFKGFIDKIPRASLPTLGPPEQMSSIIRSNFVDEVFVAVPADRELVEQVTKKARLDRFSVKIIPELYDGNGWHHVSYIGHFPCLALHREENPRFWMALKRVSDVIISLAGLIVLAPALLLLAILVRIDSRGSVLYVSQRVGKKGALFTCYKFRTMVNNAEELKSALHHLNERDGLLFKISKDPRVTRFGRFMRKYSLDELPQLWNVLRGDMSLVGPRPPLPAEVERYRTEHLRRLEVIPGITGLWQVTARRDPSFEHYVNLDLEYVENWSYALDLRIILRTIFVVLQGTGT